MKSGLILGFKIQKDFQEDIFHRKQRFVKDLIETRQFSDSLKRHYCLMKILSFSVHSNQFKDERSSNRQASIKFQIIYYII